MGIHWTVARDIRMNRKLLVEDGLKARSAYSKKLLAS
jgi:hypothetical protein